YGGDGVRTFALPNLQGCVPLHNGGGSNLGARGGESAVTLALAQMPAHSHTPVASSNAASASDPLNAFWASSDKTAYAPGSNVALAPQAIGAIGSNQPHPNMSPYLVLNF